MSRIKWRSDAINMERFIQSAPQIIGEAAKSPLGLIALMVLALASLALVFFKAAPIRIRVVIFVILFAGVAAFAGVVVRQIKMPGRPDHTQPTETETAPTEANRPSRASASGQIARNGQGSAANEPMQPQIDSVRQERLTDIIRNSTNDLERARALEALMSQAPHADFGTNPTMAVFRIGEQALQGKRADAARSLPQLLNIAFDTNQPLRLREEAIHSLAKIGGGEASSALLSILASPAAPADLKAVALHGPPRFWKRDDATLTNYIGAALFYINIWSPDVCSAISTNSRFKYLETTLHDAVVVRSQAKVPL